jgi:Ulp1 family protease
MFTTKKIAGEQPPLLPSGITLWQDIGFIGHSPKNVTVKMSTGKPKGKDLSEKQKQQNSKISSFRIAVEHAIGGVKRCRILRERFKCHKYGFDDKVMPVACGLHNFRISFKESLINTYCT